MRRAAMMALLVLACGFCACIPAVTWSPALRGRVVDAANGAPVPGALVLAYYDRHISGSGGDAQEAGIVTTNADGRFFIPGRPKFLILGPFVDRDFLPGFAVYYPVYGSLRQIPKTTGLYSYELSVMLAFSPLSDALDVASPQRQRSCYWSQSSCRQICQLVYGRACD